MQINQTANELTIDETPGCVWIFGSFFAFIGAVFVYGAVGGFVNYADVPAYALVLAFLFGAVGIAAGLHIIYKAPVTHLKIDRLAEIVSIKRRGLFKNETDEYAFDEINNFYLIEETDHDGAEIWSLGLEFSDGETLRISALASVFESVKRDFVYQSNLFMSKPMPSYYGVLESEDESETEMS